MRTLGRVCKSSGGNLSLGGKSQGMKHCLVHVCNTDNLNAAETGFTIQ